MGGQRSSGGSSPATRAGGAPAPASGGATYENLRRVVADNATSWDERNDRAMMEAVDRLGLEIGERVDYQNGRAFIDIPRSLSGGISIEDVRAGNGWTTTRNRSFGSDYLATKRVTLPGGDVVQFRVEFDKGESGSIPFAEVRVIRGDGSRPSMNTFDPNLRQWVRGSRFGTRGGGIQSRG